jgi:hypothetical protein
MKKIHSGDEIDKRSYGILQNRCFEFLVMKLFLRFSVDMMLFKIIIGETRIIENTRFFSRTML